MDLFREKDVEFVRKLWKAGVSTELHIRPGCMHAFDILAAERVQGPPPPCDFVI